MRSMIMIAQDAVSPKVSGRALPATSTVTKIQLGTMHGQSLVGSAIVKDLVVTDLNGKNPV